MDGRLNRPREQQARRELGRTDMKGHAMNYVGMTVKGQGFTPPPERQMFLILGDSEGNTHTVMLAVSSSEPETEEPATDQENP